MKKLFASMAGLLVAATLTLSMTACGKHEEAPRVKTADELRRLLPAVVDALGGEVAE